MMEPDAQKPSGDCNQRSSQQSAQADSDMVCEHFLKTAAVGLEIVYDLMVHSSAYLLIGMYLL